MKSELQPVFPDKISDKTAALLSEFLNSLAVECDARYFVQLRRYYARKQTVFDPDHPWITKPPDR